jgi:hypothetical protein
MRWPWRRRESPEIAEAQAHLDQLDRQQPEVTRLSRELQEARRRNHFSEMIAAALRGAQ